MRNNFKELNKRLDEREEEIERLKGIIEEQERIYQEALDNNEEIKIKNRRLNNIINKAIEYINSFDYYIPEDDKPELLDILRGEDNE